MTRPDDEGRFRFRTLRPGDYYVAAVEHVQNGAWMDPAFLAQFVTASIKVSLGDGETKTQDIRIAGGATTQLRPSMQRRKAYR